MKRCPTCNRTYTDRNLSYCIDDGTPLISIAEDDDSTVVTPKGPSESQSGQPDLNAPPYRPPNAYVPPGEAERRVWPWVVGIGAFLIVAFIGLAVSAWLLLPHLSRTSTNRNDNLSSNSNANKSGQDDSRNSNSNSNINNSESTADEPAANTNTDAPTDKEVVLVQLTDLEQEWTVANINADKKKLEQILADDYVGQGENGQMQGKREYIRDIKRDPSIERWEFRDLKVTLRGDRASLTGKIHLNIRGEETVFEFTDRFVWRGGRWQATGSVVAPAD